MAFLDPIEQACAEPPPRFLQALHLMIAALFATLLLVAALVRIDVVVTGTGVLTTDTAPIVLQPMERSILRRIEMKPGDVVTRGQVLATLDGTFARADAAALSGQSRALRAQLRRLAAEAAQADLQLPRGATEDDRLQFVLFAQRRAEYRARLASLDQEVARLASTLRTNKDERDATSRQLAVTRAVEAMRATLLAQHTGSRLQYLDALATRMRAERDQADADDRAPELLHGLQAKAAERDSFVEGWRREVSEALVAARAEAARTAEELAKSTRLADLVTVTAPEDAVVLEVAQRSAGSVLREAEPLVTLTPSHATLIADIMLGSGDVGGLTPGAPAEIKVDAFPYQRHGALSGHLQSIAEESVPTRDGAGAFHRARIALTGIRLAWAPPGAHLYPGMTLTAEIKIGSRSALSYFLTPITRGFRESLREP